MATEPVDFRKGHNGLAALVQNHLHKDPFTGTVYVFRSKRADRLKLLYWDGSGLVMAYKRLEDHVFKWPAISNGMMRLNHAQFEALFAPSRRYKYRLPGSGIWTGEKSTLWRLAHRLRQSESQRHSGKHVRANSAINRA